MHQLLANPSLDIFFDHQHDWLYVDWKGDQTFEFVQWGGLEVFRHLGEQRTHKILNDNRRVTSIWADAANWGGTVWFPQMAAAGLEYLAWVYSPNLYSRRSTDLTLSFTPVSGPIVATFDDFETARNWLLNV